MGLQFTSRSYSSSFRKTSSTFAYFLLVCQAIRLFSEASKEDLVTEKIFRAVVDPLLHFIMMMEDYHVTKIEALKYLEINIQHPENR